MGFRWKHVTPGLPRHWGIFITEHTRSVLYGLCTSSFIYLLFPPGPHSADSVNVFFFLYILRTIFFFWTQTSIDQSGKEIWSWPPFRFVTGFVLLQGCPFHFLVWKIFLCSIVDGLFDRRLLE